MLQTQKFGFSIPLWSPESKKKKHHLMCRVEGVGAVWSVLRAVINSFYMTESDWLPCHHIAVDPFNCVQRFLRQRQTAVHTQSSRTTSSGERGPEQVDQHADRTQVMLYWVRHTKADLPSLLCTAGPPPHIKGSGCCMAPENFKRGFFKRWIGRQESMHLLRLP